MGSNCIDKIFIKHGRTQLHDRIRAAANSTLAIGGVSSPFDSFVVAESTVLRINFCGENPAHRQSAKRYKQLLDPVRAMTIGVK
jgi:hypothetical protein